MFMSVAFIIKLIKLKKWVNQLPLLYPKCLSVILVYLQWSCHLTPLFCQRHLFSFARALALKSFSLFCSTFFYLVSIQSNRHCPESVSQRVSFLFFFIFHKISPPPSFLFSFSFFCITCSEPLGNGYFCFVLLHSYIHLDRTSSNVQCVLCGFCYLFCLCYYVLGVF